MTTEEPVPTERGIARLAEWLHDLEVGCDLTPWDSGDIGLGFIHTGEHEADARRLVEVLAEVFSE